MKQGGRPPKTALFLMELMVSITLFALASAVCVQLFAKAHMLSAQSRDLGQAMNAAQGVAESFKVQGETLRVASALESGGGVSGETLYDRAWQVTEAAGDSRYAVRVTYGLQGRGLARANISVHRLGEPVALYTLEVYSYVPEE